MTHHDVDLFFPGYTEDKLLHWFNSRLLPLFNKWNAEFPDMIIHPREYIHPNPAIDRLNIKKVGGPLDTDSHLNLSMAGIKSPKEFGRRDNEDVYFEGEYRKFYEFFEIWAPQSMDDFGKKIEPPPIAIQEISDSPIPKPVIKPSFQSIVGPIPVVQSMGGANPGFDSMNALRAEQEAEDEPSRTRRRGVPDEKQQTVEEEQEAVDYGDMDDTLSPDYDIAELETIPSAEWARKAKAVQEENYFWDQTTTLFWISVGIFVLILWALISRRRH
jgi:hypothetical protein